MLHEAKGIASGALAAMMLVGVAAEALAINDPPYNIFTYGPDSADNPPLYYTKVCEPGATDEADASYVVIGIWYMRSYQGVAPSYAGDLVIPETIEGLPVRKIKDNAFSLCQNLTSVSVPSTVREVGACAFSWCTALTNVTFAEGVASVGPYAFSNCVSLTSVTFPKSLSYLGPRCFEKTWALKDVYFRGNAPRLDVGTRPSGAYFGEKWYDAGDQQQRFTVHIDPTTEGWVAPGRTGAPEKWPLEFGWMQAYPVKADVSSGAVAMPSGIVAVVAEIGGDATAVPEAWVTNFPQYVAKFGADFASSLLKPTGKTDSSGNALKVWHDYVAGTDPTDLDDVFRATIEIVEGVPVVSWSPVLSAEEAAKRTYTVYGRKSILSTAWEAVPAGHAADYNFFKVVVRMK